MLLTLLVLKLSETGEIICLFLKVSAQTLAKVLINKAVCYSKCNMGF